ncbi:MAG: histidine kinase [Actinomycetota bacterium]|nr:histidine kinase [Actinomycetota bacterium]
MDDRVRTAAIWAVSGAGVAAAVAAAAVANVAGSGQAGARIADAVVITACCIVGAVVLVARPRHAVGRLLVAGGVLWGTASLPLELLVVQLTAHPERSGAVGAAVAAFTARGLGFAALVVVPLVFPDGRLPSPAWRRPVGMLLVAFAVTFVVGGLFSTGSLDQRLVGLPNPLAPPGLGPVLDAVALVSLVLLAVILLVGAAAVLGRWRHGDHLRRQQVGWFAAALAVAIVGGAVVAVGLNRAEAWSAAAAGIPVAIGIAVLQHRLYNIELIVNRTLRYVLLSAAVAAIYLLVVAGVGAMLNVRGSAWIAAGAAAVVAVAFTPLHRALQRGVNRMTYGAWEEPYEVLGRLGDRLAASTHPGPALAEALAEPAASLRLPHIAVLDRDGTTLAEHGAPSPDDRALPLVHRGEPVGTLVVSPPPRRGGDRLLASLTHQLAPAVAAAALTRELQRSRERLVASREEERRRLRRDLHDGMGSALAALSLRVDTARNTVGADPGVDAVLLALRGGVQDVVGDVRRVVEDLRPPALDELGLAGAVRQLAERMAVGGPRIAVLAGELPALPAAVEVAGYRIVQEALSNVLRHARARCCQVELTAVEATLQLRISDDGCTGGPETGRGGHGLSSMRERTEEVGGQLRLHSDPSGTMVLVALPLGVR